MNPAQSLLATRNMVSGWFLKFARVACLVLAVASTATAGTEGVERLVNGSFDEWGSREPVGWNILIGAGEGDGAESTVAAGVGRVAGEKSFVLSGGTSTRQWYAATQEIAVKPGEVFRFSGWLRAEAVERDGHRYGNSQAAIVAKADNGQKVNMWLLGPATGTTEWTYHEVFFQAPVGSVTLDVSVFLSMSGTLECDDLSLTQTVLLPADPTASRQERWRSDIEFVADLLPRLHVKPFTVTTEKKFRAQAAVIIEAVDDLGDMEVNLRLMALVASLGDAHSSINFAQRPQRLPIQFKFFGDDLRVLAVDQQCAALAGGRVTRMGDMDIADCLAAVRPLVACETESWFRRQAPRMLRLADVVHGVGISDDRHHLDVTVIMENGVETTCSVALPEPGARAHFTVREAPADNQPLYLSHSANYWFEYLESEETFYLQYNRCQEDPELPMAEFTSTVTAALDAQPVSCFVLDVRHNSGGSSSVLNNLISEVAQRKETGGIDRCYVITGRGTFSAAALNTLDFRRATGALVVGEPMGNKPNRFGQLNSFTLPNSGLRVQYATKYFVRVKGNPAVLAPDMPVEVSWEDYLAGRDPALASILAAD